MLKYRWLSLLLIAAFLLTACTGGEVNQPAPNANKEAPAVTQVPSTPVLTPVGNMITPNGTQVPYVEIDDPDIFYGPTPMIYPSDALLTIILQVEEPVESIFPAEGALSGAKLAALVAYPQQQAFDPCRLASKLMKHLLEPNTVDRVVRIGGWIALGALANDMANGNIYPQAYVLSPDNMNAGIWFRWVYNNQWRDVMLIVTNKAVTSTIYPLGLKGYGTVVENAANVIRQILQVGPNDTSLPPGARLLVTKEAFELIKQRLGFGAKLFKLNDLGGLSSWFETFGSCLHKEVTTNPKYQEAKAKRPQLPGAEYQLDPDAAIITAESLVVVGILVWIIKGGASVLTGNPAPLLIPVP